MLNTALILVLLQKRKARLASKKKWRDANPEKQRESERRWNEANRGRVCDRQKRYQMRHPDKCRTRRLETYWANPQLARERSRHHKVKSEGELAATLKMEHWRLMQDAKTDAALMAEILEIRKANERNTLKKYRKAHAGLVLAWAQGRRARQITSADGSADAVIARWKSYRSFICYWCSHRFPITELTIDHVEPISSGGTHSAENICKSCGPCNFKKWKKSPSDFGVSLPQMVFGL